MESVKVEGVKFGKILAAFRSARSEVGRDEEDGRARFSRNFHEERFIFMQSVSLARLGVGWHEKKRA